MLAAALFVVALSQTSIPDAGLAARVDRIVSVVDGRWVLVGASGDDADRVHQWRRLNDIMTLQVRQFDTQHDAERHVRTLLGDLGVRPAESLKVGTFAARIEWGDGRSTVYLAAGRAAVVISAPGADLSKRLSRQAALEFAERLTAAR
jgi:hypothetical protein